MGTVLSNKNRNDKDKSDALLFHMFLVEEEIEDLKDTYGFALSKSEDITIEELENTLKSL